MNDREFWIAVRAALLAIVDAIERRWELKRRSPDGPQSHGHNPVAPRPS